MRQTPSPESLRRGVGLLRVLRLKLVGHARHVVPSVVFDSFGANVHAFSITSRLLTVLNTSTVAEIKRASDKYKTDLSGASKC